MKDEEEQPDNKNIDVSNSDQDKPLPGEYPPDEDIMNRLNGMERLSIDPDNLTRTPGVTPEITDGPREEAAFPLTTKSKKPADSDLTKEDYEALGPRDLSMDGGDDEQLKNRVWPVDFGARDLDLPGADEQRPEVQGQGDDEENDYYSLGGDEKDSLEDDPTPSLG